MRETVIIGGQRFIIERVDSGEELDSRYDGRIFYNKNKIYLSNNSELRYQDEVLCHEILHAFLDKSGVASILKSKDVNCELIVEMLTNIFWQFIKDNCQSFFNYHKQK